MDNGGQFADRLLKAADIQPGSAVLDIGCGRGDVTFRLAALIGDNGHVLGVDFDGAALEKARERARLGDIRNVAFAEDDFLRLTETEKRFDVITCRRVLMYLPDRVAAVRTMKSLLLPGGRLVLQEHDASILHSMASLPLHREARSWIWDTVRAEGANTGTGFDLYGILSEAGFPDIAISAEGIVETPSQAGQTANIVKAMVPRIMAAGVATPQQMKVDTLEARLAEERRSSSATLIGEMIFGAVAKL